MMTNQNPFAPCRRELKNVPGATNRPFTETQHLSTGILQHQLGLVPDETILRNRTGLRAVQIDNIILNFNGPVNTVLTLLESKTVSPDLKNLTGIAKPSAFQ